MQSSHNCLLTAANDTAFNKLRTMPIFSFWSFPQNPEVLGVSKSAQRLWW